MKILFSWLPVSVIGLVTATSGRQLPNEESVENHLCGELGCHVRGTSLVDLSDDNTMLQVDVAKGVALAEKRLERLSR
jgi:hypothetical protein